MDRNELLEALQALDDHLDTSCHLVVVGGAAMVLYFGAERATRDVDALILQGDAPALRRSAALVADDRDLPTDWLNDGVKGFVSILEPAFPERLIPFEIGTGKLKVSFLARADQAAMKIIALRERDLSDLDVLLAEFTDEDRAVLERTVEYLGRTRPDWAQKMAYFLEEAGWTIS